MILPFLDFQSVYANLYISGGEEEREVYYSPVAKKMGKVKVRSVHRKIRVSGRMLRRIDFCWLARRRRGRGEGGTGTGERRPAGTGDGQTRREHGEGKEREKEKEEATIWP